METEEAVSAESALMPGALDKSFGQQGTASIPIGKSLLKQARIAGTTKGGSVAIELRNGNLLVLLTLNANGANGSRAVRLLPNGALDTTFGTGGFSTLDDSLLERIVELADGRILLARNDGTRFARLLPNGQPDGTFGLGGLRWLDVGPDRQAYPSQLVQASDGSFYVLAGYATTGGSADRSHVYHVDQSGVQDMAFNEKGYVASSDLGVKGPLNAVGESGGALYVSNTYVAGQDNLGLEIRRLTLQGALDPAWGKGGSVRVPFDATPSSASLFALPGGGIAALGQGRQLMALRSTGQIDPSLWTSGRLDLPPSQSVLQVRGTAAFIAWRTMQVTKGAGINRYLATGIDHSFYVDLASQEVGAVALGKTAVFAAIQGYAANASGYVLSVKKYGR